MSAQDDRDQAAENLRRANEGFSRAIADYETAESRAMWPLYIVVTAILLGAARKKR